MQTRHGRASKKYIPGLRFGRCLDGHLPRGQQRQRPVDVVFLHTRRKRDLANLCKNVNNVPCGLRFGDRLFHGPRELLLAGRLLPGPAILALGGLRLRSGDDLLCRPPRNPSPVQQRLDACCNHEHTLVVLGLQQNIK